MFSMNHSWNWRQQAFLSPTNHITAHSELRTTELKATRLSSEMHFPTDSAHQPYQAIYCRESLYSSPGHGWIIWGLVRKMVTGQEQCFTQELWGVSHLKWTDESENCPENSKSIWAALTSPHGNSPEPRGQLLQPHTDLEHWMLSGTLALQKWITPSYAELSLLPTPKTVSHNQSLPDIMTPFSTQPSN